MCGRYTLHTEKELLAGRFGFDDALLRPLPPRYNIAPTDSVLTVVERDGQRAARPMRWGLIPFWAKSRDKLPLMINARRETVATKPAYRDAFRRSRCLVLGDGFYEWQRPSGLATRKTPYWISRRDGAPFAMAGLCSGWRDPEQPLADKLYSCSIITAPANSAVAEIHERMPVILTRDAEATWLSRDVQDPGTLSALLEPLRADELESRPVSTRVNSVRNDDPSLIERFEDPQLGFL